MITSPVTRSPKGNRFSRDRAAGRTVFARETELPKLIGMWPAELRDSSLEGAARIVGLLRKALRAERRRAQSGHWTYDLTRHLALSDALKAEEARLRDLKRRRDRDDILNREDGSAPVETAMPDSPRRECDEIRRVGAEDQPLPLRDCPTAPSS